MYQVRRVGALLLLGSLGLFAQSDNAAISGVVKDPSGAVVANAKVSVRNEDTSFERTTTSNDTGFYTVTNIAPGYYTVSIEATGFKKSTKTRNKLDAGLPLAVNMELAVGALTEVVNVEASAAQLNTESATVGKTVEMKQIQNLTLNGRNPLFLALLKPGVRGGALSGFSFGLTNGGFSMNGGRMQDALITFDGAVGVRTRANGTSIGTADLDTVQEVQILTANYSAEYGRSAAGQIRMVTRSGSKDFHGSAYEYFRNSQLDANSWGRNRVASTNFTAPFRYNQYGYNISGPVMIPNLFNKNREKLFFLFAQEWVKFRQDQTTTQRVPTELMRNGNFSELLGANIFYGQPRALADPQSNLPCQTTATATAPLGGPGCFTNNIIPANRLSSNGIAILKFYPLPNISLGGANFLQVRGAPQNQRKDTYSVDYNPTSNQVFRFRGSVYSFNVANAFAGGFDFAPTALNRPNRTGSLGHTWTVSPTMVNDFLLTASVDRVTIAVQNLDGKYLRSRTGINYPYLFPEPKEIQDKVATVNIPNIGTIDGGPYPASSSGPIYNISNNLTKVSGNHTLKFGALWERSGQNDFDQINVNAIPGGTNNQNGRFDFTDVRPGGVAGAGTGLGNVALGLFSTYAEIGPRSFTPYRSHMFEFFGQDSWRVTQKLKLELGFRGTWMNGYYKSLWGNEAIFDANKYSTTGAAVIDRATGNVLSGNRFNGVVIPGKDFPAAAKGRVPAIDSGLYNNLLSGGSSYPSPNQFDIMPRFGLAYSFANKQVLRAGIGGFISRPGVYDSVFLGGNAPFQPMASLTNGVVDNPGGGTRAAFPHFFQTIDPAYKIPRSYNWNFSYQRELAFATTIEVGYVGTTANYLSRERDLNQLPTGTTFQPANAGANVNFLRPYKGFANINMLEHSGRSEYNGLQIELNRRFTKGFLFGFAYTLSKSMDNNSGPRDPFIDVFNQHLNWGKSGFDTRHVAVVNFVYEMPFFNNASNKAVKTIAGGWQLSGVTQWQTGTPFSIANGDDYLGIGSANVKPWSLSGEPQPKHEFANVNANNNFIGVSNFWFDPIRNSAGTQTLATRPANGTLPNQNRHSIGLHNPGFQNWNLAAFKNFRFMERQNVQFRFEAFNWINHPNWNGVDANPTSATLGMVTGKSSERNLQLSLRYQF